MCVVCEKKRKHDPERAGMSQKNNYFLLEKCMHCLYTKVR